MKSVYFIRTSDNRPYILVTVLAGSTEFQPLMGDADDVTQALSEGFKNKPIKKGELDGALDDDLSIEGPIVVNRESRKLIASFLEGANIPAFQSGTKPPKITGKAVVFDISDISLSDIHVDDRKNAVEYKALAFIADQTKTTFNYEVKRVRAIWDPSLSIPGTNRRGGWRCPVGTRYGGQITDRFGRNCGWGVARRIANAITNIGERLEDVDDRRRGRRVDRRNRRMIDRLQRGEGAGRVEQGLRGIAERLEGGEAPAPDADRQRGVPAMRQLLRDEVEIFRENRRRRRGEVVDEQVEPDAPRNERQPRLRDSERRRMEREIVEPGAERTPEGGRPRRPAPQRRPRGRAVRNEDQTDIGDGPRANESFSKYVDRKYREYEDRIAKIRRDGGDAGLMTREEWYGFNRGNLREAWSRANGGRAPREPRQPQQRQPRPRAPRNRRVNASDSQAQETANRRPGRDDQPIPQQRPITPPVQRRRNIPVEQELEELKRKLIDGIPNDATPEQRRLYEEYVNRQQVIRRFGANDLVPMIFDFGRWKQQNRPANENARIIPPSNPVGRPTDNPANDRAQRINQMMIRFGNRKRELRNGIPEDAPAGMRRGYEAYLDAVQVDYDGDGNEIDQIMSYDQFIRLARGIDRPAEAAPDAGGAGPSESTPDSRSNRNVFNQFREQGLPDTAFWRAPDYNGDDKAELERRFGRYYDNNNQRNERGNQVNLNIANGEGRARGRQPRPQGARRNRRPAAQPAPRAEPPSPPERPTIGQGQDESRIDEEAIAGKRVRNTGKKNLAARNNAVRYLHQENGNLADIPDGIVVDAVIDDDVRGADGNQVNPDDLIRNGFGGYGVKYENRRYKFEVVKNTPNRSYRWNVVKVTDKSTGETWFMKSSGYGQNDGLLENVGMRAAQALQFPNDENHLRLGKPADDMNNRATRWMMMRSVDQWDHGNAQYGARKWKEIGRINYEEQAKIYEGDAARIAVLDFIFDNQDRHPGNFMFNIDQRGRTRLGLIDHGLLFGGRVKAGDGIDATVAQLRAKADAIVNDPSITKYRNAYNNGINGLSRIYRHRDPQSRERFASTVRRAVEKLEKDLDTILSRERIEANGVKLTRLEVAHLTQMRRIAEARIQYLKSNQEEFVRRFG